MQRLIPKVSSFVRTPIASKGLFSAQSNYGKTLTPFRFYASGSTKRPSPLGAKGKSATPSVISSGKAEAEAHATGVAKESVSKIRRPGGGPSLSPTRTLANMCAKQDVIFYEPPPMLPKTFRLAYIAAGLQLVFWCNIAQYAFTHYTDNPIFSATQPPPPPLPLPGTEGIESTDVPLAPLRKRVIIAGGLVGTGIVIAFGICAVPWRYVTKLTLLRGGTLVKIETGRKFPRGYHRVYPIQDLRCRQQLHTNVGPQGTSPIKAGSSTHVMLGSKDERMSFFIDRRGSFKDPALWDVVFHRPY